MAVAGCASKPPPPPWTPPPLKVAVDHFIGSSLGGPQVGPAPAVTPEGSLSAIVTVFAMDHIPPGLPEGSLASQARLIAVTRSGVPVQAAARLTRGVRIAEGEAADKFLAVLQAPATKWGHCATVGAAAGAMPARVTARFDISNPSAAPRFFLGRLVQRHIGLELHRAKADTAVQLALILEDLLPPPAHLDTTQNKVADTKERGGKSPREAPASRPAAPPSPVRELVLVDRPAFAARDRFALGMPFDFGDNQNIWLGLYVEISAGSADLAHQQAVATCLDDLNNSIARARASTQPYRELADTPESSALASALEAMAKPDTPRAAMLFLAGRTNAGIFEDLALSADESLRQELSKKVFARLGTPPKIQSKDALAWTLEGASYELLGELAAAAKLPPELAAVLAVHAGEAGRHPGSLDDALHTSPNRQAFELRLIAENYIYLEDSSPASRVRAFDWLAARDRAPAGYDPLGKAKDRRAALERSFAPAPATQPAGPVSGDIR